MKPLISIALAIFNGERFLSQQIDSLLAQDYPNIEIVISDDGSTDGTWQIIKSYASQDNRIRILSREANRGYVGNFARIFSECKGEFISPSDQDDIWHKDKTRKLFESIGNAALAYCNSRYIDTQGNPTGLMYSDEHKMFSGSDSRKLLFSTSVCGHASLFKKGILSEVIRFSKTTPYLDWLTAFVAANKGGINYINEALVEWRQHPDSYTKKYGAANPYHRRLMVENQAALLDIFSRIPSQHQDFNNKAKNLYFSWMNSYLSLPMLFFVFNNKQVSHALHQSKYPYLKYIIGHKLKKKFRPVYYGYANE